LLQIDNFFQQKINLKNPWVARFHPSNKKKHQIIWAFFLCPKNHENLKKLVVPNWLVEKTAGKNTEKIHPSFWVES